MHTQILLRRSALPARNILRQAAFSISARQSGEGDVGPNKTHMHDKTGGHKDIQSENSKAAHEDKASGSHQSQATSQKDVRNNNERAKRDHPEAPEPVIGMNEERGGKGH